MTKIILPKLEIHWTVGPGFCADGGRSFHYDGKAWREHVALPRTPEKPYSMATTPEDVIGTGRQGIYKILRKWPGTAYEYQLDLSIGEGGYRLDRSKKAW